MPLATKRHFNTRHGHTWKGGHTRTYHSWMRMKRDTLRVTSHNFSNYADRGITICERWLKFDNFLADMGERPEDKFIERRDNDGNYEPSNCYWATRTEQARNRRTNHLITFQGETMPLVAWAERQGISRLSLRSRLREGWDVERALTEPIHDDRFLTLNGLTMKAVDWGKKLNIKPHTILSRIRKGWSVERALLSEVKGVVNNAIS